MMPMESMPAVRTGSGWRERGGGLSPLELSATTQFGNRGLNVISAELETPRSVGTPRQCQLAFLVDGFDQIKSPTATPRPAPEPKVVQLASPINSPMGSTQGGTCGTPAQPDIFVDRNGDQTSFRCGTCNRVFRVKRDLRQHIKCVHDKIRPYACDVCHKTFSIKPNLKRHVLTVHEKQRPFSCDRCGKAFGLKENFQKHVKMVHEKQKH